MYLFTYCKRGVYSIDRYHNHDEFHFIDHDQQNVFEKLGK